MPGVPVKAARNRSSSPARHLAARKGRPAIGRYLGLRALGALPVRKLTRDNKDSGISAVAERPAY